MGNKNKKKNCTKIVGLACQHKCFIVSVHFDSEFSTRQKKLKWNWLHNITAIGLHSIKIGKLQSSNPRDHVSHLCTCVKKKWKEMAYSSISECTVLIFTKFSELVDMWVRMINLTFVFLSAKGRCCGTGTELILGAKITHGLILPLFFALAFYNDLEYRYLNARIISDDDPSTSGITLVGFRPVTPELSRLNFVHQASISSRVSKTTFIGVNSHRPLGSSPPPPIIEIW